MVKKGLAVTGFDRHRPRILRCRSGLLMLCIFACALSRVLLAQSNQSAQTSVRATIQSFIKGQQTFNPALLKKNTTRNYVEVSPLGEMDQRDAVLQFYDPAHRVQVPSVSTSDEHIRVFGDTAIDILAIKYTVAGEHSSSHDVRMRATFVAVRERGIWKLASAQYTAIKEKAAQK